MVDYVILLIFEQETVRQKGDKIFLKSENSSLEIQVELNNGYLKKH